MIDSTPESRRAVASSSRDRPLPINRRYHDAVIVGLDNVVDKATRVHAAAWTRFWMTTSPDDPSDRRRPLPSPTTTTAASPANPTV